MQSAKQQEIPIATLRKRLNDGVASGQITASFADEIREQLSALERMLPSAGQSSASRDPASYLAIVKLCEIATRLYRALKDGPGEP